MTFCTKEYAKKYNIRYRFRNKEKVKELQKRWRDKNKEKIKEYRLNNRNNYRKWRERNKEKIKEYRKRKSEIHKKYMKIYCKLGADACKKYFKGKFITLEKLEKESEENPYEILSKECYICGFKEVLDIHHINGREEMDNVVVLCPNHHTMIHRLGYTLEDLKKVSLPATPHFQKKVEIIE